MNSGVVSGGRCVHAANRESELFANLSDLELIEHLPIRTADHRIHYDDFPLTFGDLRLPDVERPRGHPLVILIHGGQWESSYSLDYLSPLAEALTKAGVATWNLEYRRLNNPGGGYPGTFIDVGRGVDFARQLAVQHPIDLERVVLVGHSSGGHLATWAAGRQNIPSGSDISTSDPLQVSGVVDLAGVLDLEYAHLAGRDDVMHILNTNVDELRTKALHTSSVNLLPLHVPQTLIIGREDNKWRIESHERYRAAAAEKGDLVQLLTLKGANHFDVAAPCSPAWAPIVSAIFEYVREPLDVEELAPYRDTCPSARPS